MSEYKNRLKELRESLGFSIDEFAKLIIKFFPKTKKSRGFLPGVSLL